MKGRLFLIYAGLVFFFNPSFNLFDFLPDFIGALLIMCSLAGFAYFDGNFEGAYKSAKFLLWISVLKLALCMWSIMGHRDYIMPFTFITAVLETIFMISMFRFLYLGAEYTLMRSDSQQSPKAVNDAFTMSFIFTVGIKLLDFVPHISDILAQDAELDLSHNASYKMPMAQMKMYLMGACLVCGLILGVIYVIVTSKAWIKLIRDKKYNAFLKSKYEDFLVNEREVYVTKKVSLAYFLLMISLLFTADFYIDAVDLIPGFVTVICLFSSSKILCSLEGRKTNPVLFALTAVSSVLCSSYMSKIHLGINYLYSVESFNREEFPLLASGDSVVYSIIFCALEAILVMGAFLYMLSCMKHTFSLEKRKNVFTRLAVLKVTSVLSVIFTALSRVLTSICGHLASNPVVTDYVKNKAFITSGKIYEQMMSNPLIVRYENFVTWQSAVSVASFSAIGVSLIIAVNMSRATEGNPKQ